MGKIRLGIVGGGESSWIGGVHRRAASFDGRFELVAGALSSNPERSQAAAKKYGLQRSYSSYQEMAFQEAQRRDGIQAVAIATPDQLHCPVASVFIEQGIHVLSDKPLGTNLDEGLRLAKLLKAHPKVHFVLTHNYSGYPLLRQMRNMIASGAIGQPWWVRGCYLQQHKMLSGKTSDVADGGGCLAGIGSHLFHLLECVLQERHVALCAQIQSFAGGSNDNVQLQLRSQSGIPSSLTLSSVSAGHECYFELNVYGSEGSLSWQQEQPNQLVYAPRTTAKQIITRAGNGTDEVSQRCSRIPAGHPEGFFEAFAQIYNDAADLIEGLDSPLLDCLPGIDDGLSGLRLIEAAQRSQQQGGNWVEVTEKTVA